MIDAEIICRRTVTQILQLGYLDLSRGIFKLRCKTLTEAQKF